MRKLNQTAFDATFSTKMTVLGPRFRAPFDFWPAFDSIPRADFEGHDCSAKVVDQVYQSSGGRYQHVLIRATQPGVFMALVLTVPEKTVFGYRLLRFSATGESSGSPS